MDLYTSIIARLRIDAAGAISSLLLVRHGGAPVAPEEVERFVYPGPTDEPVRYCARVRGRPGIVYAGEPCDNEIAALCSLIENAHRGLAAEGGSGLPLHLVDQLGADADALAVYRREVPILLAAARATSEALDAVAELP